MTGIREPIIKRNRIGRALLAAGLLAILAPQYLQAAEEQKSGRGGAIDWASKVL